MLKLVFLKDYYTFNKDTYRVIMKEDSEYYYIQNDLHNSDELFKFHKSNNEVLFRVVERS